MNSAALTAEHRQAAAELAGHLCAIFTGLAALIARALLRDPFRAHLIVPLWTRLTRAGRRVARLMDRVTRGREQPRPPRPGAASRPGGPGPVRIPSTEAWLLAALRHEAALYHNRLARLLADPRMAELIAALPQAQRILRPLCHMLGVRHASLGVTHPAVPALPRRKRRRPPTPPPAPAKTGLIHAITQRTSRPRRAAVPDGGLISQPHPIPPEPPPSPFAESVPCPLLFRPWIPGRLRSG